jgi:F-type H+-transporting ATPase subunit b
VNINATLLVQIITFAFFVWFTMKFVWPPITKALEERKNKIAEGLSAAERGQKELELARYRAVQDLREAKLQAAEIIDKAQKRAAYLFEEAKVTAQTESGRLMQVAQEQIAQEVNQAKETLKKQTSTLAIAGAEKILEREVDAGTHQKIFDQLVQEIGV